MNRGCMDDDDGGGGPPPPPNGGDMRPLSIMPAGPGPASLIMPPGRGKGIAAMPPLPSSYMPPPMLAYSAGFVKPPAPFGMTGTMGTMPCGVIA